MPEAALVAAVSSNDDPKGLLNASDTSNQANSNSLRFLPFGLAAAGLLLAAAFYFANQKPPLPVVSQVSDFQLTNQLGALVRAKDLVGKVWVGNIIFTRCPGPCREMSQRMQALQAKYVSNDRVRFVSLTTDPGFDTPEVLKHYAERYQAQATRWIFLTGSKAEIVRVAVGDLKLTAVDSDPRTRVAPEDLFVHSTISVVVDSRGRVRGSVEALEDSGPEKLKEMIDRVLSER